MKPARLTYRIRQFWHALRPAPLAEQDVSLAHGVLTPTQMELFASMGVAEKAHALRVLKTLQAWGESDRDLLVAALLHDVGKVRCPLAVWERALAVLAKRFFPERARTWGHGRPRGWRRAFVVAEQHPYWGAQMAAESGASPLAVNLIWRHQEPPSTIPTTEEDRLLRTLQAADNDS